MTTTNPAGTRDEMLPCDPERGVGAEAVRVATVGFDGSSYAYGMHTPAGAARVEQVVSSVGAALAAGVPRETALWVLLGGFVRLERDGHGESSDTVVRESVCSALEGACDQAGVEAFTDDEVGEVALLLSLRSLDAYTRGWSKGLTETLP